MKTIRLYLFAAVLFAFPGLIGPLFAGDPPRTVPAESLFNGKDLTGWTPMNEGVFVVTNGLLRVVGGMGWLRSAKQYGDFVLEVEWQALVPGYNSGVFVRAASDGKPWPPDVWQVNLKDTGIGSLLKGSTTVVPGKTPKMPVNQWIKFRLEARGKKLTLDVDGAQVWEFNELDPERGYIGLQAENKAIEFRNIRIQELPRETKPAR